MTVVLDASALLCLPNGEGVWEMEDPVLDEAASSTVSLAELVAKLDVGVIR